MRAILFLAALAALAACSVEPWTQETPNVAQAPAAPTEPPAAPYRNLACQGEREGQYDSWGNSNVRYAGICVDTVSVNFMTTPEFTMNVEVAAYPCGRDPDFFWTAPASFYERSVPEQIRILERELAPGIRTVAAACDINLDPAAFLGPRFTEFYEGYGDGWWFARLDGGIVLTPEKGSEYRGAHAR